MNSNPLSQYFRQPAVHVRLPSEGNFYPEGALERTENSEYPVLPMTTMDEITYRTPDALYNGSAVVSVIQSCMPNIKNAWAVPSVDIDKILIAIRIATYGHTLDIETKCPSCENEDEFEVDLRGMLDQIAAADFSTPLTTGDLEIYFKPMSYKQLSDNGMVQYEEQRVLQMLQDESIDEQQKMTRMSEVLKKMGAITTDALASNIAMVKTPQAQVTDAKHIAEWLGNCDRKMFATIRDHIVNFKSSSEIKPIPIKCTNCGHDYEQAITLNMTTFFEDAS